MLMHVVLMRLRPGVSSAALDDLARRVSRRTESVAGQDSCVVGPNLTGEPFSKQVEFSFVARFADHAEFDAYHLNPAHKSISLEIRDVSHTAVVSDIGT